MKNLVKCSFNYVLITVVVMVLSFFSAVLVHAEETVYYTTPDGYEYTVDASGNATITDYTGSASVLNIPDTLDGHKVTALGKNAFMRCVTLTDVTIPDSVTSVDEYVFGYCSSLASVSLPSNLRSIGRSMFVSCEKLTSIDIPSSVTSIGRAAFNGSGIVSINIPDSVISMGEYVFLDCNDLVNVTLPAGITMIPESAFDECDKLKSINIPEGVTQIGDCAFTDCRALENVTIPASVTTIGAAAFYNCSSLKELKIPDSVTTIDKLAFRGCTALKELKIPGSVTTIGEAAFAYCSSLKELIIPSSVTVGENDLFVECSQSLVVCYPKGLYDEMDIITEIVGTGISYVLNDDGTVTATVEKIQEGATKVSVPGIIMGQRVTSVTASADVDLSKIMVEIAVPFTVTSQPADCRITYGNTDSVKMTVGITKTSDTGAVAYQWYENDVPITGATTESYALPIGKKAGRYIYYCEVTSGEYSVKTAKATVIVDKKPITAQVDSVTRVQGKKNPVFTYTVLKGALVADDTTVNWSVSFSTTATKASPAGEYKITGTITAENYDVTLIPGILTVVKSAPKKGNNIQDSKNKAVYRVTKAGTKGGTAGTVSYVKPIKAVSTVTIPATIKADGVKYKVTGIEKNAFKNNKNIKRVVIPKTVITIGDGAFSGCSKLSAVTMGANVATIGKSAFMNCTSLKKIVIPKKVKKIGSKAFYGCKKLTNITIKTTKLKTKTVGSKAFTKAGSGNYKKLVVKVPKSKLKAYKTMLRKRGVHKKAKIKK